MICVTDQPLDYVYASYRGQDHRVTVYGLTSYTPNQSACPQPAAELVALAGLIDTFAEPLTADESPYVIDAGTVAALAPEGVGPGPHPLWPVAGLRLDSLLAGNRVGTRPLTGRLAREVIAAIDADTRHGRNLAIFAEDGVAYLVGFRVEFEGWSAYK
jgi:hypothetical protein